MAIASRDVQQKKYTDAIVTEILPAKEWYPAERYHQQYLEKGERMKSYDNVVVWCDVICAVLHTGGQCSLKGDTSGIRCYG